MPQCLIGKKIKKLFKNTQLLSYPVVNCRLWIAVLQVQRIHNQSLGQFESILHPAKSVQGQQIFIKVRLIHLNSSHHMVEQSKLTSIHLFGFMLKDMAYSTPFIRYWFSGQMKAFPAYAASTWSQIPSSWQTGPEIHTDSESLSPRQDPRSNFFQLFPVGFPTCKTFFGLPIA